MSEANLLTISNRLFFSLKWGSYHLLLWERYLLPLTGEAEATFACPIPDTLHVIIGIIFYAIWPILRCLQQPAIVDMHSFVRVNGITCHKQYVKKCHLSTTLLLASYCNLFDTREPFSHIIFIVMCWIWVPIHSTTVLS